MLYSRHGRLCCGTKNRNKSKRDMSRKISEPSSTGRTVQENLRARSRFEHYVEGSATQGGMFAIFAHPYSGDYLESARKKYFTWANHLFPTSSKFPQCSSFVQQRTPREGRRTAVYQYKKRCGFVPCSRWTALDGGEHSCTH